VCAHDCKNLYQMSVEYLARRTHAREATGLTGMGGGATQDLWKLNGKKVFCSR